MSSTTIQQGRFTSDGSAKLLNLRSGVDWKEVYNSTVADDDTQTTAVGVQYYWQKGMDAGTGIEYKKSNAANAAQLTTLLASGGFTLTEGAGAGSALVTGTTITKASPPVCTAANHGFQNGDTVTFHNLTTMPQISGANAVFTIGNVTTNTFELSYFNTNTANFVAETGFQVQSIPFFTWKGSWQVVSSVITGSTTQIQFTSREPEEEFAVGTVMSFNIPSAYGMTELDAVQGTILSFVAATNTYTFDIDSTGFTPFVWPAAGAVPISTPSAQVVGSVSGNVSPDAVTNVDTITMKLDAGVDSPAGSSSDVIYWRAGTSFSVTNE